ncbi:unnamed protein product [Alopecurus aequalis]
MVKLNAGTVALLSLYLGLAVFAGQPEAASYGAPSGGKKEDVRDTVKRVVAKAIGGNPGVGAALIRLVFHDCWVHGCDGSVLLDRKPYGSKVEKDAKNNIGLAGFDVIDNIKSQLGSPENVSCADLVVLAAREATFVLSRGKIDYAVRTGRMDGVVSSADDADAILPPSTFDVTQLKDNFAKKGFNPAELAALSGAHAVGVAHLSSFQDRLDNATATPISTDYQTALRKDVESKKTPTVQDPIEPNNIRDMDGTFRNAAGYDTTGVDIAAKGVLDNSYYHANLQNRQLFRSDWELRTDDVSGDAMATFEANATEWYKQFGSAMIKLSELPAVGSRFEIRKNCRVINPNKY